LLPPGHMRRASSTDSEQIRARVVADYIAGMTDRYAIGVHTRLFNPGTSA